VKSLAATLIFVLTYAVLGFGRLPLLRVDRTGAAIIGAAAMLGAGVLTLEEAYRAVHYDTLMLLLGMMIVVANLRLSGFFAVVARWVVERAHRRIALLAGIVTVTGLLSAFFVNDTMCLVMTPLVIEITSQLRRNPVPYLLAVAMASNAGSVATITGNPQNMMVGSFSGIPYREFAAALTPVAAAGLLLTIAILALLYRDEFSGSARLDIEHRTPRVNKILLWKSIAVSVAMTALFFAGWPPPLVALIAGAALLVTRRVKPEKVYHDVDWGLLVMFAGLFVVAEGVARTDWYHDLPRLIARFSLDRAASLSVVSAALSNLVSNVPAVLMFRPFLAHVADPREAWLALAMSSTLAGNLTLVGSVANLIVAQRARRDGIRIGFWEYTRAGAPLTLASIAFGVWWLSR
jgi:Na+/H+ antiporter NhaD/arsenite permease-like protein